MATCPIYNNKQVFTEFNALVKALGGTPLTLNEFKSKSLRAERWGVNKLAMDSVYYLWDIYEGDVQKIMQDTNFQRLQKSEVEGVEKIITTERNSGITILPNGNLKIVAFRTDKSGFTSKGTAQRGRGLYLSLEKPYPGEEVYTVEFEISPNALLDRKLGFGKITNEQYLTKRQEYKDKGTQVYGEDFIGDGIKEIGITQIKQEIGIKAEIGSIDGALMNEIVLFDKTLIDKVITSKQPFNITTELLEQPDFAEEINQPTESEIKKEVGMKNMMYTSEIKMMAKELKEYNDKYNTSHRFKQTVVNESEQVKITFIPNYNPRNKEAQQFRNDIKFDAPGLIMESIKKDVVESNKEEFTKLDMELNTEDLQVWRDQLLENFDNIFPALADMPKYLKIQHINSLTEGDLNTYC